MQVVKTQTFTNSNQTTGIKPKSTTVVTTTKKPITPIRKPKVVSSKVKRVKTVKPRSRLSKITNFRIPLLPKSIASSNVGKSDYLSTRLMPYASFIKAPACIPDGSQTPIVVYKHRLLNSFTFGPSGHIQIAITPCIPRPVWYRLFDTDSTMDGRHFNQNNIDAGLFGAVCINEWDKQVVTYRDTNNVTDNVNSLNDASAFRIVSIGWSLTYSSNAFVSGGTALINTSKVKFNSTVPAAEKFTAYQQNGNSDTIYGTSGQVLIKELQSDLLYNAANNRTVVLPLPKSCYGTNFRSGLSYDFKELSSNVEYATPVSQELKSLILEIGNKSTQLGLTGIISGFDDNWDTTMIEINGGQSGATFLLSTSLVVEYAIPLDSNITALTTISPPRDIALLQRAENLARQMPVAHMGAPNPSMTQALNRAYTSTLN